MLNLEIPFYFTGVNSTKIYTHNNIIHMSYQIQNLKEATYAIWIKAVSASGKESQEGAKNYFLIIGLEYMSGIYTYIKTVL